MQDSYIYRDLELDRSSDKGLAHLLKSLFKSNGQIIAMGSMHNGFTEKQFTYWQTFYKLQFNNPKDLDKFHKLGFITQTPEVITGH